MAGVRGHGRAILVVGPAAARTRRDLEDALAQADLGHCSLRLCFRDSNVEDELQSFAAILLDPFSRGGASMRAQIRRTPLARKCHLLVDLRDCTALELKQLLGTAILPLVLVGGAKTGRELGLELAQVARAQSLTVAARTVASSNEGVPEAPSEVIPASCFARLRQVLHLSPRELEIALCVADGYAQNTIARRLKCSPHTVKSHVRRMFRKLNVGNRAGLAARILLAYAAVASDDNVELRWPDRPVPQTGDARSGD